MSATRGNSIGIGDIHTLHHAIAQSAQRIQEDQVKKVNDCSKVSIFKHDVF